MTSTWLITSYSVCYRHLHCLFLLCFLSKEEDCYIVNNFVLCMLQAVILIVCLLLFFR